MRRFIAVALLVSTSVLAETTTPAETSTQAKEASAKEWPSLDKFWNDTQGGNTPLEALAEGTPSAELLLGYEFSDLDDPAGNDSANAVIGRIRLNYLTGDFKGFSGFVQAQYVGPIYDHYAPKRAGYDTVADPETFRFHQAFLAYKGYDSDARLGAQEIILDNARFIGNVGWRLNAQSFNAGSIANHSVSNLTLFYAYADSINTIHGTTLKTRQYHMFNAEYKLGESNQVAGYAYLQRNDGAGVNKLDTYGLRSWGKNGKISHEAMLALQRNAYYGSLFGSFALSPVNVGGGLEYISGGGKNGERFQTLNGTAHKFNGWADQFLGTGGGLRGGLIDLYGQVSAVPVEKLTLMAVYHYFSTADKTNAGFDGEYGQEIDLLAKYPVLKNFSVLAKLAYYMKGDNHIDNFTNDETVFWLRGTLKF